MNAIAVLFLFATSITLLSVRRRYAPLPLVVGACYMTLGQGIAIGPFHFTVLRMLVLVGFIRVLTRHERLVGGLLVLDKLILAWGAWLIFTGFFHTPVSDALVFRLGIAYNTLGFYFLMRIFCQDADDLVQLIKTTAFILIPVAIEMCNEKITGRNLFSLLGGVPEAVMIRDGKLRAQGPFSHPILAGTVGALCIPLMVGIWKKHTLAAVTGLVACLGIVLASKSSGPIMSTAFGVFALCMWRWRRFTRLFRIAAVVGYIVTDLIMKDPAYFLMARIDLTGSSTGWHRSQLIRSSIQHLDEWWFTGTDVTRHWMATGVSWSTKHTDITNHYLLYGVWSGLPLMLLFIILLWVSFKYVGDALRRMQTAPRRDRFLIWALGAGLFSHTATCMSVAYFDQSVMFLFLNIAAIGSLRSTALDQFGELVAPPAQCVETQAGSYPADASGSYTALFPHER